ncbi:MAG: SRPBCC family protein [Acidobacteriota bacterium]
MTAMICMAMMLVASPGMFTIHADVRDSVRLGADIADARAYLKDQEVFRRHFPGILGIRRISATQSEWTYEVKPPLSGARRTTYLVNERQADSCTTVLETDPGSDDYFYCRATIAPAPGAGTMLTLELKLRSTREHGSDIHFLAPLFGENFISARMREQLMDDLSTFFRRITDELP